MPITCVLCKWLSYLPGEPFYSWFQEGYSPILECAKGYWGMDWYMDGEGEFRKKMLRAVECEDFELEGDYDG